MAANASVEYAKSSAALCKNSVCKCASRQISKGSIRFKVPALGFTHLECFPADQNISRSDMLGLEDLGEEDRRTVEELMKDHFVVKNDAVKRETRTDGNFPDSNDQLMPLLGRVLSSASRATEIAAQKNQAAGYAFFVSALKDICDIIAKDGSAVSTGPSIETPSQTAPDLLRTSSDDTLPLETEPVEPAEPTDDLDAALGTTEPVVSSSVPVAVHKPPTTTALMPPAPSRVSSAGSAEPAFLLPVEPVEPLAIADFPPVSHTERSKLTADAALSQEKAEPLPPPSVSVAHLQNTALSRPPPPPFPTFPLSRPRPRIPQSGRIISPTDRMIEEKRKREEEEERQRRHLDYYPTSYDKVRLPLKYSGENGQGVLLPPPAVSMRSGRVLSAASGPVSAEQKSRAPQVETHSNKPVRVSRVAAEQRAPDLLSMRPPVPRDSSPPLKDRTSSSSSFSASASASMPASGGLGHTAGTEQTGEAWQKAAPRATAAVPAAAPATALFHPHPATLASQQESQDDKKEAHKEARKEAHVEGEKVQGGEEKASGQVDARIVQAEQEGGYW